VESDQFWDSVTHVPDHKREVVVQATPDFADEDCVRIFVLFVHLILVLHHLVPVVGENLAEFGFDHACNLLARLFLLAAYQIHGNVQDVTQDGREPEKDGLDQFFR